MEEGAEKHRAWTDTEKMSLFVQLALRAGEIQWNTLDLPPGRTVKACSLMFYKEKAKVKGANGGTTGEKTAGNGVKKAKTTGAKGGKKRKTDDADDIGNGDDDTAHGAKKEPKKGGKTKKVKAEPVEDEGDEDD